MAKWRKFFRLEKSIGPAVIKIRRRSNVQRQRSNAIALIIQNLTDEWEEWSRGD
jgi:hypothetical protein